NVANGLHNVPGIDIARGDLRQKRRKQQEILVAHQHDLRIASQEPLEPDNGLHAAESAAEHDDALGHEFTLSRGFFLAPREPDRPRDPSQHSNPAEKTDQPVTAKPAEEQVSTLVGGDK